MTTILCTKCNKPVDPTVKSMSTAVCGICSGEIPAERKLCFDGGPCLRTDQNCEKCEFLGSP